MRQPIKPNLSDFGLSEEVLLSAPNTHKASALVAIASTLAAFFPDAVLSTKSWGELIASVGLDVILFGLSALFGGIMYIVAEYVFSYILSLTNPIVAKIKSYKKALRQYDSNLEAYDAWIRKCEEQYWRNLSGIEFERELGNLYKAQGYKVEYTPRTGDGGVDLILKRNGITTIVQCKAHAKKIPISVARELVASMADFKADRAIIACLDGVTKPVKDYIANKPISYITAHDIVGMERGLGLDLKIAHLPR